MNGSPQKPPITGSDPEWTPIACDCGKIVIEISRDRRMLRYLCGDRRHGGKVYSYIDLYAPVDPDNGRIRPVLHEELEA